MKNLEELRTNYDKDRLEFKNLNKNPMIQFKIWFQKLNKKNDFNAFILSTFSELDGVNSRVVLLKDYNNNGFVFYTNYNSLKARQIDENNNVSMCFFWPDFQRQVRVNGIAIKTSSYVSDLYFSKRPRASQLGAWASHQSQVVDDKEVVRNKYNFYDKKFKKSLRIPRPEYWGGFLVKPSIIEFWQGGLDRMHDRFVYKKSRDCWSIDRLSP